MPLDWQIGRKKDFCTKSSNKPSLQNTKVGSLARSYTVMSSHLRAIKNMLKPTHLEKVEILSPNKRKVVFYHDDCLNIETVANFSCIGWSLCSGGYIFTVLVWKKAPQGALAKDSILRPGFIKRYYVRNKLIDSPLKSKKYNFLTENECEWPNQSIKLFGF